MQFIYVDMRLTYPDMQRNVRYLLIVKKSFVIFLVCLHTYASWLKGECGMVTAVTYAATNAGFFIIKNSKANFLFTLCIIIVFQRLGLLMKLLF